uniref:Folate-biopterin transporter 9, chloroplastic n=1 Tax=Vitis vinifera TaxID=29760 RepID=A5B4P7_VITVI|nr:hypothetical protein VITISV_003774 [Vitis vinifera]
MIFPSISVRAPLNPITPSVLKPPPKPSLFRVKPVHCSNHHQNPNAVDKSVKLTTHLIHHITVATELVNKKHGKKNSGDEERRESSFQVGSRQMLGLCGFGYGVQGFRCFPWLALNFHMAHNLRLDPSMMQIVQNIGNLPMVAKPLFGILSDAFYIGGAHRIPYIFLGGEALATLMLCVLLSNLGASITEVAQDALVAEYGQKHRKGGLQSYAFMAVAAGGILGNLFGGYFLQNTQPNTMFLVFAILLLFQVAVSLTTKEDSLGLPQPVDQNLVGKSIFEGVREQFSNLMTTISEDGICRPLAWVVASIAMVPILSGPIFCYQTQCLCLDPSTIGMSRVVSQLMLLSATVLYNQFWKRIPMRKLIGTVQILYASSLLLDLVLVRQINLSLGIPNQVFALCFSGVAETIAQFKLLPFSVLFASLCPSGCEGSLTSFLASAFCLSSIFSGVFGAGLASLIGIIGGDYSSLPVGILIQFLAALVPLGWMHLVPMVDPTAEKERKKGTSKRSRRNRRVGRVALDSIYVYRREREYEEQR